MDRETLAQMFSCEFCEISKNSFSYRTPPIAASVMVVFIVYFMAMRMIKISLTRILHTKNGRNGTALILNRSKNLLFTISSNDIFELRL